MAGTDLTNVAEKELKDESEDGGAKRRHPELSASLRNIKAPPGSVVQLFLEQLTLLIEGTFLRTSGNTYTKTTGHYRLATLRRLIKFLETGIGGRREDLPASPDHFECSTSQPLSCHWSGAYSQLLQFFVFGKPNSRARIFYTPTSSVRDLTGP